MQRGSELTSHVCGLGAILIIVEEGNQLIDSGVLRIGISRDCC